jgi:hydroxypyruvate isomerase
MIGEGEPKPQPENASEKVLQEISSFLEGKGIGTTEFTAFSDNVDRFGAEISLEGALKNVAQKTLRERLYDREDFMRAESDLRRRELEVALIDERMGSRDARELGYASAAIKAHSLRKRLIEAYQQTLSLNQAELNALQDLSTIRSRRTLATSLK